MSEINAKSVAKMVRERFEGRHPSGVTIEVLEEGVRKMDNWWHVPVRPDVWPARTFELYDALADVEIELQDEHKLNLLLSLMAPLEEAEHPEKQAA